ncbi:MAG: SRPBCC domain-containing protein [Symploca sp. SIO2C1]|nr:SRPBCC domain-containing protein [Symploca sp. SIO2C1]
MASEKPSIEQRMSLMKGWTTDIVIDAPRQLVWEQVTNFEAYSDWNPFVLKADAKFEMGGIINFLENLKQFGEYWLKAEFLSIEPPNSFVLQGYFGAPFLFTVRHSFIFETVTEHQTRFTQEHQNSGVLIPYLAWRGIYYVSHQGYLDYNQALKERCDIISA